MKKIQFKTITGSIYVIDGDTLTRIPVDSETNPLRKDMEKIPVLQFGGLEVGSEATFLLDIRQDGTSTERVTSIVTEIKEID